eukprot:8485371-Alexandrium_andersonii.AAC.1
MCWIGNADALDRQLVLDQQQVVKGKPTSSGDSCTARSARSRPPASGGRSRTATRPSPGRRPSARR